MSWWQKLLGGKAPQVDEGIPAEWIADLEEALAPVRQAKPDLALRLRSFLLGGEPTDVLAELAGLGQGERWFGLTTGLGSDSRGRNAYRKMATVPPHVVVRWASVLEAAVGTGSQGRFALTLPSGVSWPETLLLHATGGSLNSVGGKPRGLLDITTIDRALEQAGLGPASLIVAVATMDPQSWLAADRIERLAVLKGFGAAVERHAETLRPRLATAAAGRVHQLTLLAKASGHLAPFAAELADWATSPSKQVRALAQPLVRQIDGITTHLQSLATSAKPDQRLLALRLVWELGDDETRSWARESAGRDKAASIQALLAEWEGPTQTSTPVTYEYTLPTIDWSQDASPAIVAAVHQLCADINATIDQRNRDGRAVTERIGGKWNDEQQLSPKVTAQLLVDLAKSEPRFTSTSVFEQRHRWLPLSVPLERFAVTPGMTPTALARVVRTFGISAMHSEILSSWTVSAFDAMFRTTGRPTLLELATILDPLGCGPQQVLRSYCTSFGDALARDWPAEAVWPFFAHNLDLLLSDLAHNRDIWIDRNRYFTAIAALPAPPEKAVNALFAMALGTTKADRVGAQAALANLPGKEARIVTALSDGKAEVRAVAARWLGELRYTDGVGALEATFAKEKNDATKGAILDALEALGQGVGQYLDRNKLAKEAESGLAKGLPKELEWFPWSALPTVRWEDGSEASTATLQWLLAAACRQKSPEPNAMLRKFCSMMAPRDREAFGQFVLEAWIAEDTRPMAYEDALALARTQSQSLWQSMQTHPQYFRNDPRLGKSLDELASVLVAGLQRQPVGSAIASKGILAVAAACGRERVAATTGRYLKEYYGTRLAHGKALIAMLAWVDHPTATQLMLSVGNRFRTKGLQAEAQLQANALAERKGWTLSELADRTIPTGGFDDDGTLELSYGPRSFTAKLRPDLSIALFGPDGKHLQSLPAPRQDDDAELAREAKKTLANAKKEVKAAVAGQTERFYEALCTERGWPLEDWLRYLAQHPIARRLVQRLVWAEMRAAGVATVFRPLDDGSLTNVDDEPVVLPAGATVRLAHDSLLTADQVAAWCRHLDDYEVTPLFQQLGKGVYQLPSERRRATVVEDFEGHLLEAFALRGRATKLGYQRGETGDGGWFWSYEKAFPTLGLIANIEFSGNGLPEENRTVALGQLSFVRVGERGRSMTPTPLVDVPTVLLSECYHDLRLLAAAGSGFDQGWREKVR